MIAFYKSLFRFLFDLFEVIGNSAISSFDDIRAFTVVFFISLFEWLNVLSVLKNVEPSVDWVPLFIFFVCNSFFFLLDNRFKKIKSTISLTHKTLAIAYLAITIILFAITR